MANKYFGTDGFRGEVNVNLTSDHAYKIGRFLGWYYSYKQGGNYKKAKIIIGKDTRRSSYMLEYSIAAGITASGADVYMLHVTTTPSVSYIVSTEQFDCGIMITASHNPFYDNGIKVINRLGEKLDDETTALIEKYIDGEMPDIPLATGEKIGQIIDYVAGRNRYVGYLISLASHSYKKIKIGLDCANGAAWNIAKAVFGALGTQLYVLGDSPDGLNINKDCGSTKIENLCKAVKQHNLDLGFAFDGDCDRCIAVDENGQEIDGDKILYILAKRLKKRDMLNKDTVVATVMSNSGLVKSLEKENIKCVFTTVGDRYVHECIKENGYSLGGEQSGHVIIKKYATTGDGLLTAIMLTEEICDTKLSLSKLCEGVKVYPQFTKNIKVKDKAAVLNDSEVQKVLKEIEALINGEGRALLRQSGTEPVIRIMIESESEEKCKEYAEKIAQVITNKGYCE